MTEEIFDVVDADDNVIGQMPRSQVHAEKRLHRAVSIFVFNSAGRMLLHKRSATKDEYPGRLTSSASGHLSAGETYAEAAPRELVEELGLSAPLEFLAKFPAGPETAFEHTVLYRAISDEPPQFDPEEIESGEFLEIATIAEMLRAHPEQFTPPFQVLFQWYLQYEAADPSLDP